MTALLPEKLRSKDHRVMVFVDGENLSIRSGKLLSKEPDPEHVGYEKDVYIWSSILNKGLGFYNVLRKYYYTSANGDRDKLLELEDAIGALGIEAARVFPRPRGRNSKQVDISLTTDMLSHAYRDNFDIAILVSGDRDFVPVVNAVCAEGKIVVLWSVSSGLSDELRRSADYFFDLDKVLIASNSEAWGAVFHAAET